MEDTTNVKADILDSLPKHEVGCDIPLKES